jgi:nucleoside-diphosphate-sugar epimerase
MVIFLTGATGYIGGAVADALLNAGHSVIGLARSDEAAGRLHLRNISVHHGDLNSPETLASAAGAADGVIHTGTTNDGVVDLAAVRAMLDAVAGSDKPFVYTSGVWVIGDTGGSVADETWPTRPAALVEWRVGVEQLVLGSAARNVRPVVIRPGVVYGRGGGIPASFVESVREGGAARYVGDGENHWPVVDVDDLADLYVRAVEKAPAGTLLIAAEQAAHRVRKIAQAASTSAGVDGRAEAWPLEDARKILGGFADALALDQQVSSEKARALLGWRPRAAGIIEDLRRGSYVS